MVDTGTEAEEVHNRNLIRTEEHLSISVDNDRSNLDALNGSQNPKIEPNSKSTTKSDRICSGLGGDPRLQHENKLTVKRRSKYTKAGRKVSQKLREQKNEILSRTLAALGFKQLLKGIFYYIIIFSICYAEWGANAVPVKPGETSVVKYGRRAPGSRGLSYGGAGEYPWERADGKRPWKAKRQINKNCKEYDVTSRAFSADLIFEGKVRSKRGLGQDITFGIHDILKAKKTWPRPKDQIRIHFGGRRSSDAPRGGYLADCLSRTLPDGEVPLRWKLKFGTNYYVFADLSGPMNYTAIGDPIVANRRNLKSISSVVAKNKEKPPTVRGLQDKNLKTNGELKLACRVKGTPVPRINWYKDGVPLIPSPHVNVTYYRKNSTVEIKSLDLGDRGRYECRATSITGKVANMSAYVNVSEFHTGTTSDPDWPFRTVKCQVDSYCLNDGKCEFIEKVGEHMCRCKSGYVGARCENKQLSTIGTRSFVCGFNVGYSSYYC